jgi:hypothetical protein
MDKAAINIHVSANLQFVELLMNMTIALVEAPSTQQLPIHEQGAREVQALLN